MKKKHIVWIGIGIFLVWACSAVAIYLFVDEEYRGVTGDMFGAVNALFSGLAFAGLIYTITVQRQELALQEAASKDQANDLKRQRELLQFQFVLAHVKEILIIKNNRISNLNFVVHDTTYRGISAITQLVREKHTSDRTYYPPLKQWMDSFFYILQYIDDSELEDKYKNLIIDFIFIEVSWSEVHVLYGMNQNDGHIITLLDKFELKKKIQ